MGTTPGGLVYQEPTEPMAGGAVALKNVALKLDPAETMITRLGTLNDLATSWGAVGSFNLTTYTKGGGLTPGSTGVTVATAGRYRVEASITIGGDTRGTRRAISFGVSTVQQTPIQSSGTQGGNAVSLSLSATLTCVAGDLIGLRAYHDIVGATLDSSNIVLCVKREP